MKDLASALKSLKKCFDEEGNPFAVIGASPKTSTG